MAEIQLDVEKVAESYGIIRLSAVTLRTDGKGRTQLVLSGTTPSEMRADEG